jgi:acetoin utilization deacetylase AcuC-like enzyme
MAKYSKLRERILAEGIIAAGDLHEAPAATLEQLRLVHDAAYVDAVANGTVPHDIQRRIGFPWSPQMVERSRRSVGATIAASLAAVDEGVAANLAGGTHHAFADRGEGFCVFNDVAVAARVLQRDESGVLNRHQPDFVFYLAGADPYEGDRLGRLTLTIGGLRERDTIVLGECSRAGLPVAVSMSGGYAEDVDAIVSIHTNTIRTAAAQTWHSISVS